MSDVYKQKIEQAIKELEDEIETLMQEWRGAGDLDRSQIWTKIESRYEQIKEKKQKTNLFDSAAANSATGSIRQSWEDELLKIDFKKAKALIENFKKDDDRRYVLWLLENTIVMEGELILRWLENYLRGQGHWTKPFVHGFTTTANKEDFIRALTKEYAISPETELNEIIRLIRARFRMGEIFFINIDIPTDGALEFLEWFVQEFWQPFTQNLDSNFAVAGVISLDRQLKSEDSLDEIVCKFKRDRQKIICLKLENWTKKDIEVWLRDCSGLGQKGYDMAKVKEVADRVWNIDKGKPVSTRNALARNLERLLAEANQKE